jgi:hypothetical protein
VIKNIDVKTPVVLHLLTKTITLPHWINVPHGMRPNMI